MTSVTLTSQRNQQPLSSVENALCGASAGLVSRFAISPFDVVKIRLQLQHSLRSAKYRGVVDCFRTMVVEEGALALWKGNMPALILYLTYGGTQFWAYDEINKVLIRWRIMSSTQQKFAAGAMAGALALVITYPFDLLRTRFAIQGSGDNKVYSSMGYAVREIIRTEGVQGLYQGLGPSLVQIMPYMGLMFGTYESVKVGWRRLNKAEIGSSLSGWGNFVCGGLAGVMSKMGVFPFDTVRKRMQIQGPTRTQYVLDLPHYRNLSGLQVAKVLVQQEGLRGLYKGLVPGVLKAGPSSAVTFGVFEMSRNALLKLNRRNAEV